MAEWTEEEARAYLPRLRRLLASMRRIAAIAARARTNGHGGLPAAGHADGEESPADGDAEQLDPDEALAEIEARGIILRDLDRGLVDFPARHPGGRDVLLCWQLGEADLEWWHLPDEGFAGRRRLPLPPEL